MADVPLGAGNVTTADAGVANNITVAKPANVANGDTLVAAVYFRNSGGTITLPDSGWKAAGPINTVNETFGLYYKTIPSAAAETATNYNFATSAGSSRAMGIIFRVVGNNHTSVKDSFGSLAPYTGTSSVVIPETDPVSSYTILIAYAINNNTTTGTPSNFSAPAGMTTVATESADNGTTATSSIWVGFQILTSDAPTGTRTPTISPAAANSGGLMVTLSAIPVATDPPDLGPDQTVNSQEEVTITGSIGGTVTTWYFDQTGGVPVTLNQTSNVVTFDSPATVDGTVITIGSYATIGGVDSPIGYVDVNVRAHQWWVRRSAGWQEFANPEIAT